MKKNWLRIGMVIGLVILFGILLVTVMSFKRDRENIDMNLDDSEQDTIVFQNNSSMTEQEITSPTKKAFTNEELTEVLNKVLIDRTTGKNKADNERRQQQSMEEKNM